MRARRLNGQATREGLQVRSPLSLVLVLVAALVSLPACYQTYPPYDIEISNYDPAQAYAGKTFFQSHIMNGGIFCVDMDGQVLWEYRQEPFGLGFDILGDGTVIHQPQGHPQIVDPDNSATLWQSQGIGTHHTLQKTPWGTFMSLHTQWRGINYGPRGNCPFLADYIEEFDLNSQVVWQWHLADHVDPVLHHPEGFCENSVDGWDWSHCNTVKIVQNYTYRGANYPTVILLLSRELDTFYLIDYQTGDIIWSFGQHGTFGRIEPPAESLFNSAHEIDLLPNGHFILFDNGRRRAVLRSRALEIAVDPEAGTAEEVWSWTDPDIMLYAPWGGDADRFPNGNTLLTDVINARLIEVNPQGEPVWEMKVRSPGNLLAYSIYQMKRVPQ